MNKQVTVIALQNSNFTSGNGTATDWNAGYGANTLYEIDVQQYNVDIDPEFYTGSAYDKALSGKLRQNMRGLRPRASLSYDQSLQSGVWGDLLGDIITAFVTNNVDSITFHPDNNAKSNSFEVVVDESSYSSRYTNTVGLFVPSLTLIALNEITSIPTYLQGP